MSGELLQVMVAVLQMSDAATSPGLHGGIDAGLQPRFMSLGQMVNVGGVVSTIVMVCTHVAGKPPLAHVQVQVRVMTPVFPHPGEKTSLLLTLQVHEEFPQTARPDPKGGASGAVGWPHSTVTLGGQ